jgi:hypothetical protein
MKKKVIIFVPSFNGRHPHLKFSASFDVAVRWFNHKHSKVYELSVDYCTVGPHCEANRNVCVGRAIEGYGQWKPDIAVFLDGDLIVPQDILEKLICREDYKVVAGMYFAKRGKFPVCFNKGAYDSFRDIQLYNSVVDFTMKEFEVDFPGEGCFRIDVSVLKKLKAPYFLYGFRTTLEIGQPQIEFLVKHGVRNATEGGHFFEQVRDLGYKMVVDPRVQCKHIAEVEVGIEDFEEKYK